MTSSISALPTDDAFAEAASEQQLQRAAEALRAKGLAVHVTDTVVEARTLVNELLLTDKTIFTSTSETLRQSGLADDIDRSGRFLSVRAAQAGWDLASRRDDVRVGRSAPEVVVGSVHAVTEDGTLLAASATGSQLAPYASGAGQVLWIVGAQKVVPDLDAALRRIETYSYPKEDARAQEAYGARSAISKILIVHREVPGRATVVLVREPIGF